MKHRTILVVAFCLVLASMSPTVVARSETSDASTQQSLPSATHCFQDVTFQSLKFPAYRQNAHNLHVEEAMSGYPGDGPQAKDNALTVQVTQIHAKSVCLGVKPTGDKAGVQMTFHKAVLKKTSLRGADMRFKRATADSITFHVPQRIAQRFRSLLNGGGTNGSAAGSNSTGGLGGVGNRTGAPGNATNDTTHKIGNAVNNSTKQTNNVGDGVNNVTD
ncbi:MAG TPA: hypothetical protein VE134_07970, partial [Methanomicrobiales archaeon]|nr:hypothetical protein [Methanomicrobiales archaeon]